VLSGVLLPDQNCVITNKVRLKDSPGPKVNADDGDKCHCPDHYKLGTETCAEKPSDLLLANDDVRTDDTCLRETQISASVQCNMDITPLTEEFYPFVQRVKCLAGSSLSDADIIQMAVAETQLQKRIVWINSDVALQSLCELSVRDVLVARGAGVRREQARQAAYSAAVKLLSKPHLQLQESREFGRCYVLLGADDTLAASSSSVGSTCRQKPAVADKGCNQQKQSPDG